MKSKEYEQNHGLQVAGNAMAVTNLAMVALYDPRDGEIYHYHQSITFEGGDKPTIGQIKEDALLLAKQMGNKKAGLMALHLKDYVPGIYRVDTKTKKMVEIDLSMQAAK